MNIESLVATLGWRGALLCAASLAVGALVRLLKDDTTLPTLPKALRPWLSIALGAVAGVLDAVIGGSSWKSAIAAGAFVGLLPILGHLGIVEWLRGGKELPLPGPITRGPKDPPDEPPTAAGGGGAASANGAAPSSGEMHFSAAYRAPARIGDLPPREPGRGLVNLTRSRVVPGAGIDRLVVAALCAFAAVTLTGCAGTFEEARLAGLKDRPAAAPVTTVDDRAACVRLDDERIEDAAKAKGLGLIAGVGAGATGALEVVRDEGAPRAAVISAGVSVVVLGAAAGYYLVRAEGKSEAWVRRCSS